MIKDIVLIIYYTFTNQNWHFYSFLIPSPISDLGLSEKYIDFYSTEFTVIINRVYKYR